MNIIETTAKTILRKRKRIDSWFLSKCGMNLYRGCSHNCVYCDGRAEEYYVSGEFGKDVCVKTNAPQILKRELDPATRRKPQDHGFLMLGGGVGDSYQPVEEKYKLTRQALELADTYNLPVHILTKSTLVKRDIDIIDRINKQRRAIVSFSFSSVDEKISSIFEPGVPSPDERLETMEMFQRRGIPCGMFLMPVIPFITDIPARLEATVRKAKEAGAGFVLFSGMTLKEGKHMDYFMGTLLDYFPELEAEYSMVYRGEKRGNATDEYSSYVNSMLNILAKRYEMPRRIPPYVFKNILKENDHVAVMLEHMDYFLRSRGQTSPYRKAAYSVTQIEEPLSNIRKRLRELKGVGNATESIIKEIMDTGTSRYYDRLAKL
ncbi:MAG: radical SAM protein [Deltaproteobacteria bacterium]|nr:radical SAM protein [Deltaproteobacteria bacterium]